jgi:hypothetical protein
VLRYFVFGFLSIAISLSGLAQEESTHHSSADISGSNLNRIGLFTGITLVPEHLSYGKDEYLVVPTYGIEYERVLKKWLAIGFLNELEMENYIIEVDHQESIKRSYIYVASVVVIFQPVNHLVLFAGPGYEFTSEHNFAVIKAGVGYNVHITREWNLVPEVFVDRVSNLYTTISFGLSIGKMF